MPLASPCSTVLMQVFSSSRAKKSPSGPVPRPTTENARLSPFLALRVRVCMDGSPKVVETLASLLRPWRASAAAPSEPTAKFVVDMRADDFVERRFDAEAKRDRAARVEIARPASNDGFDFRIWFAPDERRRLGARYAD